MLHLRTAALSAQAALVLPYMYEQFLGHAVLSPVWASLSQPDGDDPGAAHHRIYQYAFLYFIK